MNTAAFFGGLSLLAALGWGAPEIHAQSPAQTQPQTNAPAGRRGGPGGGRGQSLVSPEIHLDRTVTFRVRAANATNVTVAGEMPGGARSLTRDERGVWSVTMGPLEPNIYSYSIAVDGFRTADPSNSKLKPEPGPTTSMFQIRGEPPLLHDLQDVPHGVVSLLECPSKSLGKVRYARVYTPPGYEKGGRAKFPILYLLHGSGDNEGTWSDFGHAHVILDNLLAQKTIKPMIVVMADGHAAYAQPPATNSPAATGRFVAPFEHDLLEDLLPLVEGRYRVRSGRENRAIVGLSMGGGQALGIGLNHLELFAWVGGMSSAVGDPNTTLASLAADPKATNEKLKLLWFACGKADSLLGRNQQLDDWLKQHNLNHEFIQTEGGHAWPVWRNNLAQFTPLIFGK